MSNPKVQKLIRFDSLFKYKDIGDIYYQFLKADHSEETWEFLMQLQELAQLKEKEITDKIDKLVEGYLLDGSLKEINISSESKKRTLEKLQEQKNLAAFEEIRTILITEMKYDSFKRFVRSKECAKIIQKYWANNDVIMPVLAERFNYKNEDFSAQIVNDEDLKFMDILYQDSPYWELQSTFHDGQSFGNGFWSHENYIPNVSIAAGVSVAKYDLVLPYEFERVLCAFFPLAEQIKFDPQVGRYETINFRMENGKPFSTILYDVTFDKPFNCRFYPMVASGSYDPELKKAVQIFKPCDIEKINGHGWMEGKMARSIQHRGEKETLGKTYRMYDFQSSHIQKVDERRTLFTQIHLYCLGGWITNRSFMKLIARERGKALLKDLVTNIKKTPEDAKLADLPTKDTFKGDGLAQILYNLDIHKKDVEYLRSKMKALDAFDINWEIAGEKAPVFSWNNDSRKLGDMQFYWMK